MIELTKEQFTKLRMCLLEIMDEFDRVCRKNGIKYSMAFGTMLGAVRHKGFIPWDDDMDVFMDRENYLKFAAVAEKDLKKPFEFISITNNNKYGIPPVPRVMKGNTTMIETCRYHEKWHNGIFVDIFVYDNISDDPVEARKIRHKVDVYTNLLTWKNRGAIFEDATSFSGRIKKAIKNIVCCVLPSSFFAKRIEKNKMRFMGTKTKNKCMHCYPFGDQMDLLEPAEFDSYVDLDFEGRKYMCISGYDHFLSLTYGNYMEYPPEEERVPGHHLTCIEFGE